MRRSAQYALMLLFALSSFFSTGEKAEALCPIGDVPVLYKTGDGFKTVCEEISSSVQSDKNNDRDQIRTIQSYLLTTATILTYLAVPLGMAGITASGMYYVMSGGNAEKIEKGKKWLIRTGVGLFIIGSAYILLQLFNVIAGISF
jgi:hypothetical protein